MTGRQQQRQDATTNTSSAPGSGGMRFERTAAASDDSFTYIGKGRAGGKAAGLAAIKDGLEREFPGHRYEDITVSIPRMIVIRTGVFEEFMEQNHLSEAALSGMEDERIAHLFQKADLPATVVGDLLHLVRSVHEPLAIRSSSLLEDSLHQPLAGVYETKMIPNSQPDAESRFHRLVEAIKIVYASTYYRAARQYFQGIGKDIREERMAVIIQEVVGYRYNERFYPTISGVARSYNFYPSGNARPEEGVVHLALGLGKTIVDGGRTWSYSPAFPRALPPYASISDLLKNTQTRFWSVFMGTPKEFDPIRATEYLHEGALSEAEYDGTLPFVCSTYEAASDRLQMGCSAPGARLVDFSPVLKGRINALNELLIRLLKLTENELGQETEIEFAVAMDPYRKRETHFGFLQLRPMVVSSKGSVVDLEALPEKKVLISSQRAMGNGVLDNLRHVLYLRPEAFEPQATPRIAAEVESINTQLLEAKIPYVLVGFGRWGSVDPWLGIPVRWSQISGARVIVETTLPDMNPDLSQGSHFFHNLTALGILYLCVPDPVKNPIDWTWLDRQPAVRESEMLRLIRCGQALTVGVDGRSGKGVILE